MTTTQDTTGAFPLAAVAADDYPRLGLESLGALTQLSAADVGRYLVRIHGTRRPTANVGTESGS